MYEKKIKFDKSCNKPGVIHVDGTYSLIKNRFPVFFIGITDIDGQFFPIAFCITSNEKEIDYLEFFNGVKKQAKLMNIRFKPEYIMLDAASAGFNAAEKSFPHSQILMCYFHVKLNIKKKCKEILVKKLMKKQWFKLNDDVSTLHYSSSQENFKSRWNLFKKKYKLSHFIIYNYIKSQWVNSRFCKWFVFNNKPGYANTNSPIESYNATIKRDFFERVKRSVYGAVQKLSQIIAY